MFGSLLRAGLTVTTLSSHLSHEAEGWKCQIVQKMQINVFIFCSFDLDICSRRRRSNTTLPLLGALSRSLRLFYLNFWYLGLVCIIYFAFLFSFIFIVEVFIQFYFCYGSI